MDITGRRLSSNVEYAPSAIAPGIDREIAMALGIFPPEGSEDSYNSGLPGLDLGRLDRVGDLEPIEEFMAYQNLARRVLGLSTKDAASFVNALGTDGAGRAINSRSPEELRFLAEFLAAYYGGKVQDYPE